MLRGLHDLINESDRSPGELEMAVRNAQGAEKLSTKTASILFQQIKTNTQITDPNAKDIIRQAQRQIAGPSIPGVGVDPESQKKALAFQLKFTQDYLRQQRGGTLPPNALDLSDEHSLISQAMKEATGGPSQTVPAAIHANGGIGAPIPAYTAPAQGAAKPVATEPIAPAKGSLRSYQGMQYEFQGGNWRDPKNWKQVKAM